MSYEVKSRDIGRWEECEPVKELATLLDRYPDREITLGEATWRKKPRDEELILEIWDIISTNSTWQYAAEQVYDLLERKGLV